MIVRFEPDDVAGATFSVTRRGYDTDEVRAYLRGLGAEVGRLRREIDDLRAQLTAKPREVASLDEAEVAQALGEEAARVLTTAREAAMQIRTKSEEAAATLVDEAERDAVRTREHADVEAARLRQEAIERAEAEIEEAKREGREMVAEARAVRERMLDDIRRRREVAKAQLEQLRLGHERVLGTFELAADALAAVTADLRALVPDVRRNSAVETGPLPTVLPVGGLEAETVDEAAARVEAVVAPSPVHVSVPVRPEAEVVDEAEPVAEDDEPDEPARPTVLLSSFSLGESPAVDQEREVDEPVAVAEEPADEVEPEPEVEPVAEIEDVELVVVDEAEVEAEDVVVDVVVVDEQVEVVDEPVAEPEPEPEVEVEVVEATIVAELVEEPETSAPAAEHHPRPSTDDLFARIRAARTAVTEASVRATAVPLAAPEEVAPEPVRASVLVADPPLEPMAQPTSEEAAAVVAARNEQLAPVELAVARRLKRALADEQNEVLDRLRRKNPTLELDALVGSPDDHAAPYDRAVRDEIAVAVAAGARSLRPDLDDAGVAALSGRVVESVLAAAREQVVTPLRERVARLLDDGADAASVTAGVRTLYRDWKTQRLDAAARHLVLAAHGQAAYAALVPGTPVCWAVDPSQPCPDGEDNALGGPTPAGQAFPTGHLAAPAYVGCRCALAPAAR